jgi:hypothetical protein
MNSDRANKFILVTCFVLAQSAIDQGALAQSAKPDTESWVTRCANWIPPPWDGQNVRRLLFPVTLPEEVAGSFVQGGKSVPGTFVSSREVIVSLISEPGRIEPSSQFVTRTGTTIGFLADGKRSPQAVTNGRIFRDRLTGFDKLTSIECVRGISRFALEAIRDGEGSLGGLAKRTLPPERAPRLADVFANRETSTMERPGAKSVEELKLEDVFRDKGKSSPAGPAHGTASPAMAKPGAGTVAEPPAASTLTDVFGARAAPSDKSTAKSDTPAVEPGRLKVPAVPAESTAPIREAARTPAPRNSDAAVVKDDTPAHPVCDVRTLAPLSVASRATLASFQAVGVRNGKKETRGFEYFGDGSNARAVDGSLDIADSTEKLIPYEAIPERGRGRSDLLLVSMAGTDETRLRQTSTPAKNVKTIRVIVVAGAAELAISGLDQVDGELRKPGSDPVKLDVEWYAIDETGAIAPAGRYSSLDLLVKDAAAKKRERPDVLNERQLLALLDNFEKLLKSQTQAFSKVFWIKGAYPIPTSVPQRFESFITAVSSSGAAPHTPSGQPGKWLVVVTYRMPGFSVAYLKEPIYSLQIGDVIEETAEPSAGPRRLISDPALLATRLRMAGIVAKGDTVPDRVALAGRLVLNARDVFIERGFVLSPDTAQALQRHLQRVLILWDDAAALRLDVLEGLANGTGKSVPTVSDVLQAADHTSYPRLPSPGPVWFRKPIKDLTLAERRSARAAVATYAESANRLLAAARESTSCRFYYVAEAYFGFDKIEKPPATPGTRSKPPRSSP